MNRQGLFWREKGMLFFHHTQAMNQPVVSFLGEGGESGSWSVLIL